MSFWKDTYDEFRDMVRPAGGMKLSEAVALVLFVCCLAALAFVFLILVRALSAVWST